MFKHEMLAEINIGEEVTILSIPQNRDGGTAKSKVVGSGVVEKIEKGNWANEYVISISGIEYGIGSLHAKYAIFNKEKFELSRKREELRVYSTIVAHKLNFMAKDLSIDEMDKLLESVGNLDIDISKHIGEDKSGELISFLGMWGRSDITPKQIINKFYKNSVFLIDHTINEIAKKMGKRKLPQSIVEESDA
jgi:hypothetical protein